MRHAALGLGARSNTALSLTNTSTSLGASRFGAVPHVFPRSYADVPFTLAACPAGYTTQKIGGQSKCCKTVMENGHMVVVCIEKAGVAGG